MRRREFITLIGGVSPLRNSRLAVILFAASLIILWGNAAMAMTLKSPAFQQNGDIPSKYTCEGEDVSPPLAWEDAPNGAKSLVLIIDDPDAPDPKAPKMVWVHWVVYNMPPDTKSLPENAGKARLPQGALLGLNDFKKTGYGGPCPPIGRHRYFHKLYALDNYNRKEGRALGEVTKFLVYNARKRQEGGDAAAAYFERTECVAGVQDVRFQQLMPDVIHWLGLRRIDRFVSMSDMKHDSLVSQGVEIVERIPIPDELVPADAQVEIAAKKAAGYFTPDGMPPDQALTRAVGRPFDKTDR